MEYFPPGVLNSEQLKDLHERNVIRGDQLEAKGSAFDLHLGTRGWSLHGSIKQNAVRPETVEEVAAKYGTPFQLDETGVCLKRGTVAVLELKEAVDFSQHPWLSGEATGKSSIGRLDILTRLLVNGCPQYERVPPGYHGPLFVEIAPISFDIRVYPGNSLNQLRIHCGTPAPMEALVGRRLLFNSSDGRRFSATAQDNKTLSLDIDGEGGSGLAAYVLRKDCPSELDFKQKKTIDASKYFEAVKSTSQSLTIEVNRFYILKSVERLVLPEDIAVTGMAYSENLGELRIHYAGFAHPWFGADRQDKRTGTPLIFEVRAHSFPIVLRHEEVFAAIRFYKMSKEIPEGDKDQEADDYTNQELKLSNYFQAGSEPTV
jgi:dCTP deaminase